MPLKGVRISCESDATKLSFASASCDAEGGERCQPEGNQQPSPRRFVEPIGRGAALTMQVWDLVELTR